MTRARWAVTAVVAALVAPAQPAVARGPRDLLPNLVVLPSAAVYVGGPGSGFVDASQDVVFGCHPAEAAQDGARRCLRFETRVANLGEGALELHYRGDQVATTRGVAQRVYATDGSARDVAAGTYEIDPAHGHFHYSEFAVAHLWRSDAAGRRVGKGPLRSGRKDGFCLVDSYRYRSDAPARYAAPNACYPTTVGASGEVSQVNGVSPGWVDVYGLAVPHQYLEVSGVADGYYLLQISVDPGRRLREVTTKDNAVWQRIRLCGEAVELVGRAPACGTKPAPLAFGTSPHVAERLVCPVDTPTPLRSIADDQVVVTTTRRARWSSLLDHREGRVGGGVTRRPPAGRATSRSGRPGSRTPG